LRARSGTAIPRGGISPQHNTTLAHTVKSLTVDATPTDEAPLPRVRIAGLHAVASVDDQRVQTASQQGEHIPSFLRSCVREFRPTRDRCVKKTFIPLSLTRTHSLWSHCWHLHTPVLLRLLCAHLHKHTRLAHNTFWRGTATRAARAGEVSSRSGSSCAVSWHSTQVRLLPSTVGAVRSTSTRFYHIQVEPCITALQRHSSSYAEQRVHCCCRRMGQEWRKQRHHHNCQCTSYMLHSSPVALCQRCGERVA